MVSGYLQQQQFLLGNKIVHTELASFGLVDGVQSYTVGLNNLCDDGSNGADTGLIFLYFRVLKTDGSYVNLDLTSDLRAVLPNTGNNVNVKGILDGISKTSDASKIWLDRGLTPPNFVRSNFAVYPDVDYDVVITTVVDNTLVSAKLMAVVQTPLYGSINLGGSFTEPALSYKH